MISLHDHQEGFLGTLRERLSTPRESGDGLIRRIVAQAPTGSGKTVVASEMMRLARGKGRRALFLVHGRQIVYQTSRMLTKYGIEHGVIMANAYAKEYHAPIQVASIDTLASYVRKGSVHFLPGAELVIADEAHESTSPKWESVLQHYPDSVVVGLTATPARSDGVGLDSVYEELVLGPTVEWLTANGFLVPAEYYSIATPDLSDVKVTAGEYNGKEIDRFMQNKALVGDVVDTWRRYAGDRPTIVFAAGVAHSRFIEAEFNAAGVSCFHVDANTPQEDRDTAIDAVANGDLRVITNNKVFNRGFDCPPISCVIDAQPTKSPVVHFQKYGRGLRTSEGKENCLFLDHTGNILRHGPVAQQYPWTLHGTKEAKEVAARERLEQLSKEIVCSECGRIFSDSPTCPSCGHRLPVTPTKPQNILQVEGELKKLTPEYWEQLKRERFERSYSVEDKRRWFGMLVHYGRQRDYKKGWAAHMYRSQFGVWPRKVGAEEFVVPPDAEVLSFIGERNRPKGARA